MSVSGRPTFRAAATRVRVPATSANLGPGFDAFGLALSLYDDLVAQVADEPGVRVDVHGEGSDSVPRDHRHLVAKTMMRAFDEMGGRPRGLDLVCANRIPHGRGLGSSAAAIVGGLTLARAIVVGGEERLSDADLLDLAVSIEGHPDNVVACIRGGATIAWTRASGSHPAIGVLALSPSADIIPVVCVPSSSVATKKARALLPEQVPHVDAAWNAARSAMLSIALTQRTDLLFEATEDRLHQNYRRPAFPRSSDLVDKLRAAGIPTAISGAGPTVIAFASSSSADQVAAIAGSRFTTDIVGIDREGTRVLPLDA